MKKNTQKYFRLFIIFCLTTNILSAQKQLAPNKYFLQFTDKFGVPYSVSRPEEFLSQKAIERREKHGILISENDLPVNQNYVDSLQNMGLKILHVTKWLNGVTVYTETASLIDSVMNITFISQNSDIKIPAGIKYPDNDLSPVDILEDETDTVIIPSLDYGAALQQTMMTNGQYLHNGDFLGQDMLIAILDAGYFRADTWDVLENLRNENRIVYKKDFVSGGDVNYNASSHGAKVLSIISSDLPGKMIGAAPGAKVALFRTEDSNSEYLIEEANWVAAVELADSIGADVVTTSLGYSEFDDPSQDHSYTDLTGKVALSSVAANIAASKGILVISSAGNEGNDPWKYITAPGDAEHVITVGAVTADSSYAFFSSVGPNAAGQIKPNVAALGVSTSLIGSYGDISSSNGTSFATPIIAGLTACLWQSRPWSTNLQVKKALEQSSHQSSNPDSLLGYGIPDFFKAYMLLDTVTEKIEKQDSLHVYPNPFNDELMIQYPPIEEHTIIIELYNLYGNKFIIKKITPNPSGQFNLKSSGIKNLSSGIYILKIKTRDDTIMQKIIKHP